MTYEHRVCAYEQGLINQWRDSILDAIDHKPKNLYKIMELANTWETRPTALAIEELEAEGLITESYCTGGLFQNKYFVKA